MRAKGNIQIMGQVLKGLVRWQGTVQFSGESGRGHQVTMDGPESSGGQDAGFRPMELILLGVGLSLIHI